MVTTTVRQILLGMTHNDDMVGVCNLGSIKEKSIR